MDAFGQHYASSRRFDDEEPLDRVMAEAKTYFANIVMLYGKPIGRVLERAGGLAMDIIAPSHGVIWRSHKEKILSAYTDWVAHKPAAKVLVLYDTMWGSTGKMARAILSGATESPVEAQLHNVRTTDLTTLATEVLDAAAIAFGSPTLNKTLMPQMAAVLTYLKGLSPQGKAGFAFGSYGWAKGGAADVDAYLKAMKFELLREPLRCRFVPDDAVLEECRRAGRALGEKAVALAG
jgi:flavorubredoxin